MTERLKILRHLAGDPVEGVQRCTRCGAVLQTGPNFFASDTEVTMGPGFAVQARCGPVTNSCEEED